VGAKQKFASLEQKIVELESEVRLKKEMAEFIKVLAEMPDDAVLLYTHCGMSIQNDVGRAAKAFIQRMENEQPQV
jgi:hypothetical protein